MKRTILILSLFFSFAFSITAQTIEELYRDDDYEALAEYAKNTKDLTARELYCVGYALYRVDRDREAIKLYDQAIEMGLDSAFVYYRRGRAKLFLGEYVPAREDFRTAIALEPEMQVNYTEMGITFAYEEQTDSALHYLRQARNLPFATVTPYTLIPRLYAEKGEAKRAREEYAVSAALLDANSPAYLEFLSEIGRQAYAISKDYTHSVRVYSDLLRRAPEEFMYYPKLMKALSAIEEYGKADSLFNILQEANRAGKLGEEFTEYGRAGLDEFEWEDRLVVIYRYLEIPTETLKPIYIAFVLDTDGESIDRIILTEKTVSLKEGESRHLLCEQMDNGHATYPRGWSTDDIPYPDFKELVIGVLNGEIKAGATSYFGKPEGNGKKKKGRKRKKN